MLRELRQHLLPRSIAVASSRWHIIGSTTASCGFTANPDGTHCSEVSTRSYSSAHSFACSGSTNENDSAPMPFRAASRIVSRREHATHSGGCGRCIGLGTTLRGGIRSHRPSYPANGSSTNIRVIASSDSSQCARLSSRDTPNPPSSACELDSPVPNSTRPPLTRSSVATRSATRAGWL
jgi:hypothetical protein